MTCQVEDCDKPVVGWGWCDTHYRRWLHHGTVEEPVRGLPLRWLKSAVAVPTDECILWPYRVNSDGYGCLKWQGRQWLTHHVALLLVGRTVPEPPLETRHTCNVRRCINPVHLIPGTKWDNKADSIAAGTHVKGERNWSAKLNEAKVRSIRASDLSPTILGQLYGVDPNSIRAVRRGETWAWVK